MLRRLRLSIIVAGAALFLANAEATAQSQVKAKTLVYTRLWGGLGNPKAIHVSAACLFQSRHELSAGYAFYSRRAQGIPSDYENRSFLGNSNNLPDEDFRGLELSYGYVLYPRRIADRARFTVRGGVLIGHQSTPRDFYPVAQTGLVVSGPNYQYYIRERTMAAFVVNPTFDYTPGRVFGLSAGAYGIVSEDFSGGGVSIGILLGKVGNRMRQSKK